MSTTPATLRDGPMALRSCETCAHVFNAAFDPNLIVYDERYDNTLHHSPTFRGYARSLIERLDETHSFRGKHVVELGCGKGEFLTELCAVTHCSATGFDPSYEGDAGEPGADSPRFVREFMTPENAPVFDFFVSRHVLEHLENPKELLRSVREASHGRTVFGYLEVPNAMYDFERCGWDHLSPCVVLLGHVADTARRARRVPAAAARRRLRRSVPWSRSRLRHVRT